MFANQLRNRCIIFHTDNIAVCQVINKQRKSANEASQKTSSSVLKVQYNVQIRAYFWLFKWLIR